MEIVLTNLPEEKQRLLRGLQLFAREHELPAEVLQAADLALEEHLTNIMSYAYDEASLHRIQVRLLVQEECLEIEVEDDGKPFNPLERPRVDTTVPLQAKPIGGLGIHLMRQFMDELAYRRESNRNILCMRKRFQLLPRRQLN